jgi:hypothetical protein
LWIVGLALDGSGATIGNATAAPTSYSNLVSHTSSGTSGTYVDTAERALTASSENPGAWTSPNNEWVGWTLSVPPAAAGGTVTGVAAGNLGALAGAVTGTRTVLVTAGKNLGALTGTVAGTRTVLATAGKNLGSLAGTVAGTRTVLGSAGVSLGALAGTALGSHTVRGTAGQTLGSLTGTASGFTGQVGIALGTLGELSGTAVGVSTAAEVRHGSWQTLWSITQEARQLAQEYRSSRPVACPNDGEPLQPGADGVLRCPFDGWREGDSEWH